ncbi:MAG: CBS domain-containing protein, partial [Desulfobulbaceae bacterium]|nr:CBS domain-containing protein [Desulfobulbaceae bacterium]
ISASSTVTTRELIELIRKHGFSRIPIYSENPDHIIGILHAKDLLISGCSESSNLIESMVKSVFFAQENQKITTLLRDFQSKNTHMAVVTDEFGSIRGLITLEDVLEEIVGEIEDESDKPEEQWHLIDEHTLITSGKVNLEEIENFFHVSLPDGHYESVAGFIIDKFDRVPETGAETTFQSLTFTVLSASKRRIETIKIHQDVSGLTS